jgi:hypothetical protein
MELILPRLEANLFRRWLTVEATPDPLRKTMLGRVLQSESVQSPKRLESQIDVAVKGCLRCL